MYYFLTGEINQEKAVDAREYFKDVPTDSKGSIYVASNGGDAMMIEPLVNLFNQFKDWEIVVDSASSSAAEIALLCNNKKRLGFYFKYLLLHRSDIEVYLSGVKNKNPITGSRCIYDSYERIAALEDEIASAYLTESEMKDYQNHDDVVLDFERANQVIDYFNKKNGH